MSFTVLFLCTGNYYRSRFAEILFNQLAAGNPVGLRAESRGIAIELGVDNVGPISAHTLRELDRMGIDDPSHLRFPLQVSEQDFRNANLIIALDADEHHQMMRERYPDWAHRIEYWNVPDIWAIPPEQALPAIKTKVVELIRRLAPL